MRDSPEHHIQIHTKRNQMLGDVVMYSTLGFCVVLLVLRGERGRKKNKGGEEGLQIEGREELTLYL